MLDTPMLIMPNFMYGPPISQQASRERPGCLNDAAIRSDSAARSIFATNSISRKIELLKVVVPFKRLDASVG